MLKSCLQKQLTYIYHLVTRYFTLYTELVNNIIHLFLYKNQLKTTINTTQNSALSCFVLIAIKNIEILKYLGT